jgi:hypothetical protein
MSIVIKQITPIKFSINDKIAIITDVSPTGHKRIKFTEDLNTAEERVFKRYIKTIK